MIRKVYTSCCAFNQMTADNTDSFKKLAKFVGKAKIESRFDHSMYRQGGAKALFCMTTHSEKNLEKNLQRLGFEHIRNLNRREGYAPGKIKMWILDW